MTREAGLKAEEVDALMGGPANFSTGDPVDDAINTVLRGALRMTAATTAGNRPAHHATRKPARSWFVEL